MCPSPVQVGEQRVGLGAEMGAGRPQFMTRSSSNDKADNGRIFMIVGILCIACFLLLSPCRAHPRCNDGHFRMLLKLWKNEESFMTKDLGR